MKYLSIVAPYLEDQMSMDVVHARMLGEFIRRSGVRRVVEVGCCWGVSTALILEALEWWGTQATYIGIDPVITPGVRAMASRARDAGVNVVLREEKSLGEHRALEEVVDDKTFVVLDGDHDESVIVPEVQVCLAADARAIAIHDMGTDGLPGPKKAVDSLPAMGWTFAWDCVPRPGMRTQRGLAFGAHRKSNIVQFFVDESICSWG